ncbi:unnamed protein product [Cuscuta europaea]|uniref:DUF4283 domain-containing protein n=1 Tax=Cuscuta europaea TaxID=41803 RepID=A0A9P0Z891_CUSEU|nr:unnamed protein product [Cuscuta europaea]
MARKKQGGAGVSSTTTYTSRSSQRFALFEGSDEEFPELISAMNRTGTVPATIELQAEAESGKQLISTEPEVAGINKKAGRNAEVTKKAIPMQTLPVKKTLQLQTASKALKPGDPAATLGRNSPATVEQVVTPKIPAAVLGERIKGGAGQNYVLAEKPKAIAVEYEEETVKALTIPKEADMGNKPWNTLFKDNRAPTHGIKLRFIQPKGNVVDFTNRVMPTMVEMWGHCLVGCFTGRFPGLKAVYEMKEKWEVRCLVRPHDKGWIIFKFQNDADRMKVLNEGPYTIFGKLLMLKVLSEDFSFDDEEFLKVPIWVKLPNLPLQLWNEEAMSEVASMIGTPLTTDRITQERANHNFARVLIEVDVSKPPPLLVPIRLPFQKVFNQRVVYETFPNYCFHCKKYGHHPFICKELAEKEIEEKNGKEKNKEVGIIKTAAQDALKESSCHIATRVEKRTEIEEGKLPDAQLEEGKILEKPGNPKLDSDTVNKEVEAALKVAQPVQESAIVAPQPPAPKKGPGKKMVFKIRKC